MTASNNEAPSRRNPENTRGNHGVAAARRRNPDDVRGGDARGHVLYGKRRRRRSSGVGNAGAQRG